MKFYNYGLVILILLGFMLAGCKSGQEKSATIPNKPEITVYKSPSCGCCSGWESHLTKAGFKVTSKPTENMTEIRNKFGVPEKMQSCHTAVIEGYVIEGHVPASDIDKLLETRPDVVGLAAPGMPAKSPGMQPEGEIPANYDVLSFDRSGNAKVFTSY